MLQKNYTEETHKHNENGLGDTLENLLVSSGRCIIPHLNLVLDDSMSYLPGLTKLELLSVLNKANELISNILLETSIRVAEENL